MGLKLFVCAAFLAVSLNVAHAKDRWMTVGQFPGGTVSVDVKTIHMNAIQVNFWTRSTYNAHQGHKFNAVKIDTQLMVVCPIDDVIRTQVIYRNRSGQVIRKLSKEQLDSNRQLQRQTSDKGVDEAVAVICIMWREWIKEIKKR